MQKISLINRKPYKQALPHKTIETIRNILYTNGIFTIEDKHFGIGNELNLFSCRIIIANNNLHCLNIGTNGKGKSVEYSLASGYGEFMERLQTDELFPSFIYYFQRKLFIYNNNNCTFNDKTIGFCYTPDEKIIAFSEALKYCPPDIIELLKSLHRNKNTFKNKSLYSILEHDNPKTVLVPFYSVSDDKKVLLPFDIIRAIACTNGTCAGNTREEALIQGICEIFERYALKKIFFEKAECPDIPPEYFDGTKVMESINKVKALGDYEIRIKDCSFNTEVPIIGLLVIDKENYKYIFRLGVDTCPEIALERCLTELYQGLNSIEEHFLAIENTLSPNENNNIDNSALKENYINFTVNGRGYIPKTLLSRSSNCKQTEFDPELGTDDKTDLNKLFKIINKLGYSIYIRDCSFLGFPSYYIFIPGMSDMFGYYNPLPHETDMLFDTICNMDNSSDEKLLKTAEYLKEVTDSEIELDMHFKMFLPPVIEHDLSPIENSLFLSMLFFHLEEFNKSYLWIKKFLEKNINNIKENKEYFCCIKDFLKLKSGSSFSTEELNNILITEYEDTIVAEVMNDMSEPSKIFQYYNMSKCFDCEKCVLADSCCFKQLYSLFAKVKSNPAPDKPRLKQ